MMVDWTARQALMLETTCPRPWDWSVPIKVSMCGNCESSWRLTLAQHDDCRCLAAKRHSVAMWKGVWVERDYAKLRDLRKLIQHVEGVSREHCVAVLSTPPNAFWKFRESGAGRRSPCLRTGHVSFPVHTSMHRRPSDKLETPAVKAHPPPLVCTSLLLRFLSIA